ncbi:hypothetical protein EDB81DRAFT_751366 [Dactylonectria macrodidyma]|uniref:DUF3295 domain-containing protein n=1 Tax=Dactylonectria macrodidyma TaxID=307937 RepID=A0A9P9FTY9_9HYPO|nr:hypothetical protein EDB81DRAFT_751366 [Dactylonectria macrodidyma]
MTADRPIDPVDGEAIVSQHTVVDKVAVGDRENVLDEDTTFDDDTTFDEDTLPDEDAIDDDSDWESDGVEEFVRIFTRVPCVRPPSTTSLISLAVAERAEMLKNASPSSSQLPEQSGHDVNGSETTVSTSRTSSTVSLNSSEASCPNALCPCPPHSGPCSHAYEQHPHPFELHSQPTNGLYGGGVVPRPAMQREREDVELRTRSQPVPNRPAQMPADTPFNSPATNRRCMIIAELPDSLRQHMLWERYVGKSTVHAADRRLDPLKVRNRIFKSKI